jgi:hypothetical protein
MEEHIVKILEIHNVTHDVKSFRLEKPPHYHFTPGHATEVSVNKPGWKHEKRPFTFTSLNDDIYLEFTIKRYENRRGVTNELHQLSVGDKLIIRDVWGAIEYKGPGCFIAGGAGITPFIAILRQLHKEHRLRGNKLIFSNKTAADIIYKDELSAMLGKDMINILSEEQHANYRHGHIDKEFLKKEIPDFHIHFYVCGPDKMVSDINGLLTHLGASPDTVVFEK